MSEILKIGDSVMWLNDYGKEPVKVEVIGITLKDKEHDFLDWDFMNKNPREVFITLDNGRWCYPTQIESCQE